MLERVCGSDELLRYFLTRTVHSRTWAWDQVSIVPQRESMAVQPDLKCDKGESGGSFS